MKGAVFIFSFFLCLSGKSQVGIGTTEPEAQLDIVASNPESPENIDGMLIPRLKNFPATNPGPSQNGMLIFLNNDLNDFTKGFYFWNNQQTAWSPVGADKKAANFYEENTTESPENIDDPIFRKGNIGIGAEEITSRLQIAINPNEDEDIKKGIEIDNNNSAETRNTYAIEMINRSKTNAVKYGLKSSVSGDGEGEHYGIHNVTNKTTGSSNIYGIYNRVGRTEGASSKNYGILTEIGTSTDRGTVYGIYAKAEGNNSSEVYAGYFAGRLGIGKTPEEDYVLPETRGEEDQVLVTDDKGEVHWEYNTRKNYSSTGTASGNFVITDEIYSLRITNSPSSLTLPDAATNRGRILILIGWQGSGSTALQFVNGDTLYDLKTDSNIIAVPAKEIMMIQSIGTRWLLISN